MGVDDWTPEWLNDGQDDGVMPAGAVEWDELLEPPLRFASWPYTENEIIKISDTLPASSGGIAVTETIFAARWFIFEGHTRDKSGVLPKADPHNDSRELRDAICAASDETFEHLSRYQSPLAAKSPVSAHDLLGHLSWFEHDHRLGFRNLPERHMDGAPRKTREEALVYRLWTAWSRAHAMRPPARRWPAFRAACLDPLSDARFRELKCVSRSERAWQSLLWRARKRFEGARN
jgi:hypothetical protein